MTLRALLIVSILITLSTLAFGQTSRGTVAGTVTDPSYAHQRRNQADPHYHH
jgi:hypothetical protein